MLAASSGGGSESVAVVFDFVRVHGYALLLLFLYTKIEVSDFCDNEAARRYPRQSAGEDERYCREYSAKLLIFIRWRTDFRSL